MALNRRPRPPMGPTPTVRVRPLTENAKKYVRHYPEGTGFNDDPTGTPWPNDGFTHRRIRDGDIEIVGQEEELPPGVTPPSPAISE